MREINIQNGKIRQYRLKNKHGSRRQSTSSVEILYDTMEQDQMTQTNNVT